MGRTTFVVLLLVVNAALVLSGVALWQRVIVNIVLVPVLIVGSALLSKPQRLAWQAQRLGWEFCGIDTEESGFRDALLTRRGIVARISWSRKCVFIVSPSVSEPLADFAAVEHYLLSDHRLTEARDIATRLCGEDNALSESLSIHYAKTPQELLAAASDHPHIGRIAHHGWWIRVGSLVSRTRTVYGFDTHTDGEWESVALPVEPAIDRFILTINKSFVLLSMKDGSRRVPIICKRWARQSRTSVAAYLTRIIPVEDTYQDADGLKWVHSYGATHQEEEVVAFDATGAESIRLTM
jgi:hypothetical protein